MAEDLQSWGDDARESIAFAQRNQKILRLKPGDKEFKVGGLILWKFNKFGTDNKIANSITTKSRNSPTTPTYH